MFLFLRLAICIFMGGLVLSAIPLIIIRRKYGKPMASLLLLVINLTLVMLAIFYICNEIVNSGQLFLGALLLVAALAATTKESYNLGKLVQKSGG